MTMLQLTFNSPKKPWPDDKCNARRCIQPAAYRYREVDLWPGKHEPRTVVLCQKHAAVMQQANEAAGVAVPPAEMIETTAIATQANQSLVESKQSPAALLRQAALEMKAEATRYLEEYEAGAAADLAALADFEVTNETAELAGELLTSVKQDLKDLDVHRKERAGIFGKVKSEIDSWYRQPKAISTQIKHLLETKLKEHRAAGIAKQKELIDQAHDASEPQVVKNALVAASDAAQPDVKGTTYIDRWLCKVTDAAAVPREYLTPDLEKLGELARSSKGTAEVPGVEFYNDPIVRSS